jgi:hypothetical protein
MALAAAAATRHWRHQWCPAVAAEEAATSAEDRGDGGKAQAAGTRGGGGRRTSQRRDGRGDKLGLGCLGAELDWFIGLISCLFFPLLDF